jgi:hypothetical protein
MPSAAHFIYIPGILLIGIVIGWILATRAAADARAAEMRRRGGSSPPQGGRARDGSRGGPAGE